MQLLYNAAVMAYSPLGAMSPLSFTDDETGGARGSSRVSKFACSPTADNPMGFVGPQRWPLPPKTEVKSINSA
jgi:hypothetical protein